jgi:urease accessory protein
MAQLKKRGCHKHAYSPSAEPCVRTPPDKLRHGVPSLPQLLRNPSAPQSYLEARFSAFPGGVRAQLPLLAWASDFRPSKTMLTVQKNLSLGQGLSPVLLRRATQVTLDWATRQRSRFDTQDSRGRQLGVFLPRGSVLRGGDVLVAEDGSLIQVLAKDEAVMRVSACGDHGTPCDLLRAAYHLGNRHVALEITAHHLHIEPDHVLAAMLRQMHLIVTELDAPFEPEGGAYQPHTAHSHAPARRTNAPSLREPGPVGAQPPGPHVHGPGCDHDHDHARDH